MASSKEGGVQGSRSVLPAGPERRAGEMQEEKDEQVKYQHLTPALSEPVPPSTCTPSLRPSCHKQARSLAGFTKATGPPQASSRETSEHHFQQVTPVESPHREPKRDYRLGSPETNSQENEEMNLCLLLGMGRNCTPLARGACPSALVCQSSLDGSEERAAQNRATHLLLMVRTHPS